MALKAGPYTHTRINTVKRNEQMRKVYEMRLAGKTHKEIADEMCIATGTVHGWIKKELERSAPEAREEVRQLEVERLDFMYTKLHPRIEKGDEKAINSALRIMDRRAKLLGLDMPAQIEVTATTDTDKAIQDLIGEMEALNAARQAAIAKQKS